MNPAGLGVRQEASVYADFTVDDPGSQGQLRQLNLGFNARGLSFGYERDRLGPGIRANTYKLGFGVGEGRLAVGMGVALYRGVDRGTGLDLGASYKAAPPLVLAAVISNIGGGAPRRALYTGSATLQVAPGLGFGGLAAANSSGFEAFGLDARAAFNTRLPLGLFARLDTDQKLRRTQFAFGLSIGGAGQVGLVATTPGDVSSINDVTLYGVTSRMPGRHR